MLARSQMRRSGKPQNGGDSRNVNSAQDGVEKYGANFRRKTRQGRRARTPLERSLPPNTFCVAERRYILHRCRPWIERFRCARCRFGHASRPPSDSSSLSQPFDHFIRRIMSSQRQQRKCDARARRVAIDKHGQRSFTSPRLASAGSQKACNLREELPATRARLPPSTAHRGPCLRQRAQNLPGPGDDPT
jgi:hypothetical protein